MIANADIQNVDQRQFLGEIMDGIQHNLHERGKQQTVNVYNNFTQYLKFEKNNKMLNLKVTNNVAIDKKQKEEIDGDINEQNTYKETSNDIEPEQIIVYQDSNNSKHNVIETLELDEMVVEMQTILSDISNDSIVVETTNTGMTVAIEC
eukprot:UN04933